MKETELRIRVYPDRVLRKKSQPFKAVTKAEKALVEQMAKIMYAKGGIGLAAPQVGIGKQLIIVDVGRGLCVLFNPHVKSKSGSEVMEEGCLSLPGVGVKIKRAQKVFIQGLNEHNNTVSFWAEDLFARALQHEIDHLKGKLIIDYANIFKKIEIKNKFRKTKGAE